MTDAQLLMLAGLLLLASAMAFYVYFRERRKRWLGMQRSGVSRYARPGHGPAPATRVAGASPFNWHCLPLRQVRLNRTTVRLLPEERCVWTLPARAQGTVISLSMPALPESSHRPPAFPCRAGMMTTMRHPRATREAWAFTWMPCWREGRLYPGVRVALLPPVQVHADAERGSAPPGSVTPACTPSGACEVVLQHGTLRLPGDLSDTRLVLLLRALKGEEGVTLRR